MSWIDKTHFEFTKQQVKRNMKTDRSDIYDTTSVFLTGSMTQNYGCVESSGVHDPLERLKDYLCAITLWLKQPVVEHLIFCDASGFLIPEGIFGDSRFQSMAIDLEELARNCGKGIAESRTIEYAMMNNRRLGRLFYKCTGRLFIANFSEIHDRVKLIHQGICISLDLQAGEADTRFFRMDQESYDRCLLPHTGEIYDYGGPSIEQIYYHHCNEYHPLPKTVYVGRSGHSGRLYDEDYPQEIKDTAGRLMKKIDLSRFGS